MSHSLPPTPAPIQIDLGPYVGLPYAPAGRAIAKDGGIDCWGLLRLVYLDIFGIEIGKYEKVDFDGAKKQSESLLMARQGTDWVQVYNGDVAPLDVILLNIMRLPLHVGIVVDPDAGTMLNSRSATGASVIECYKSHAWIHRTRGFYRHTARPV